MNPNAISPDALNRFRHAALLITQNGDPRASRLLIVKEEIASLRKHGIAYRSISDLLTQNGIPTSSVSVMKFCHRYLNDKPSRKASANRKAPNRANPPVPSKDHCDNSNMTEVLTPTPATSVKPAITSSATSASRGPRIAKVELLPPGETI